MISASNLSKQYRLPVRFDWRNFRLPARQPAASVSALRHLTFSVNRGEILGLLGPNGAGKTTTVKILSTLLIPDEGTASVNGYDTVRESMKARRTLGILLDNPERGFVLRLTCYQNLEFYASIYGVPSARVRRSCQETLDLVGLTEKRDHQVQALSRGMKQKLALARALVADPPVLLLDEPTLGLDPRSAKEIRAFLVETLRNERGKTLLITTHNLQEAQELCDRVAILDRGELMALDTPENLRKVSGSEERATLEEVFLRMTKESNSS